MNRVLRRLVIPAVAGVMTVSAVMYASAGAEQAEPPASAAGGKGVELRVMSYNIQHARGADDDVSVHRVAHRIAESGAEVVALQEVDVHWSTRSDLRDQAAELAELLDMHVYFAPIYSFEPGYDPENPGGEGNIPAPPGAQQRAFGLAVLSEYPIVSAQNHDLTRRVGRGPDRGEVKPIPGFADVTVNVKGVHVRVFSAHLQSGATDEAAEIRTAQVAEMLEIVGDDPTRTVLMGDLNEDRSWPFGTIEPLFDTFADAWELGGEGDGLTAYLPEPDRRIDYVLTSPDVGVDAAEVVASEASDHLPVVADLTFRR
ncbi:endonuclease/exonuclease/phosphatase family protein [Phytoactinopolyspora mesophila]|uniref:Metal-dependent hydrolase n=1 Tax=Phytoactinopolyspora mesophila TaxID=2650750 RepID=A0A7K3LWZ6_9ACTN|nr:endonuclease/exonuclease/phosphatase family protein [Phytoactinopolyspora mesophila]NDL55549.1 metal-dependent hydrolase [Phytoactinopolyspora mesophila]